MVLTAAVASFLLTTIVVVVVVVVVFTGSGGVQHDKVTARPPRLLLLLLLLLLLHLPTTTDKGVTCRTAAERPVGCRILILIVAVAPACQAAPRAFALLRDIDPIIFVIVVNGTALVARCTIVGTSRGIGRRRRFGPAAQIVPPLRNVGHDLPPPLISLALPLQLGYIGLRRLRVRRWWSSCGGGWCLRCWRVCAW